MLKQLQRDMLGAVYGDAASFANSVARLAPTAAGPVRALYLHTATVTAALTGVLAQAYPAVRSMLGDEGFNAPATRFLREQPPALPLLSAYGEGFAAALPATLRDMARLDWAAHRAYFAADVLPLSPQTLASLPPESLGGLDLRPVPSVSLLPGCNPAPWLPYRPDLVAVSAPFESPTVAALVWRQPDLLVAACPLDCGLFALLNGLGQGVGLLPAAEGALAAGLADLPAALAFLLNQGLLTLPEDAAS
jgi:hypothetical protein